MTQDFLLFAEQHGLSIPESASVDLHLRNTLELAIAHGRWGAIGLYTMIAMRDQEIADAVGQFRLAEFMLTSR